MALPALYFSKTSLIRQMFEGIICVQVEGSMFSIQSNRIIYKLISMFSLKHKKPPHYPSFHQSQCPDQFHIISFNNGLQQIDTYRMSIFFNIGRNPKPDFVEINCQFISIKDLKGLISSKTGVGLGDLKVKNVISGVEYAPNEYIKRGSSVSVQIAIKNYVDEPLRFQQIIGKEKLQSMLDDCRFYIVKSSNQDNIQKARDCSVWATTYPNQDKFKTAFQCFKHVFILFGTNRSYELKGLARMESQPEKIPDKSIWSGVGNIRLGGNFKLRWIRKKPLSLTTIEKHLGLQAKDQILKATDGYQPDPSIARKVALLFELPSEPYYKLQDLVQAKKEPKGFMGQIMKKPSMQLNVKLANWALGFQVHSENPQIDNIGIQSQQTIIIPKKVVEREKQEKISKKKSKKSKSKKDRKKKRKHSSDSSRSPSSSVSRSRSRQRQHSASSSSSSSYSREASKKRQKVSAMQKKHGL